MDSEGLPYIEDKGFLQVIPKSFQKDVDVWTHEFSEYALKMILYDWCEYTVSVYHINKISHILTSMILTSGYIFKGRFMKMQPRDYHLFSQRRLD